jgi:predicted TIM-barrel fold metal-dependent hydrolase
MSRSGELNAGQSTENERGTRREFISHAAQVTAATMAHGPAVVLAKQGNQQPSAQMDCIDCHTHFYDPRRPQGVPWPAQGSSLYRTVLPKHLRALPQALPVTGTVIVEASSWLEDNQWLLDLADEDPFVVGIVGHLNPGTPAFAGHLKRFAKNRLYRGIRVGQAVVASALKSGDLSDLKRLSEHDLQLDVNGGPTMPAVVAQLARRLPELRIVVNHIGNVRITKQAPPREWAQGIRAAAGHKHVYCKVSALVEGAARGGAKAPTDVAFYRPYLDILWDAFGDNRLIYGSDWPVSERAADYKTQQKIVLDYVNQRGPDASRQFFATNARAAYKWVERPGRRST